MHRVHLVIQGRVQGVGFRYFVLQQARVSNLGGWVRNLSNGDVEIEAEGPRSALEPFLAAIRRGPASASVSRVTETSLGAPAGYERFLIRPDPASP